MKKVLVLFCIMMFGSVVFAQSLADKASLAPEVLVNYYKPGSEIGPGGVHPSMWTKEAAHPSSRPVPPAMGRPPVHYPGYYPGYYPAYYSRRVIYSGSRTVHRPPYYKACKKMLGYWDPYYCAQYYMPNGVRNPAVLSPVINVNYSNTNNNINNNTDNSGNE